MSDGMTHHPLTMQRDNVVEIGARNRARIAIMDGLGSASLDELTVISKAVARIAVLREAGAKEAPLWWYPMCELDGALRVELADLRREREREHAGGDAHEAPRVDGSEPTYEGRPLSEALTDAERRLRATTILDVMRGLQDRASLAEIIVIQRCLQRFAVPHRTPRGDLCMLDEALLLELTDVRLDREHAACAAVIHGEGHCHSGMHQPSCPARSDQADDRHGAE